MSSTGASYSPEIVDRWVRHWDELRARCERPAGGHIGGVRRAPGGSERMGFLSTVRADIEAAVLSMPSTSLERRTVEARMAAPGSLDAIARRLHRRADDVRRAYPEAIRAMSASLGYPVHDSTWGRPADPPMSFVDTASSAA